MEAGEGRGEGREGGEETEESEEEEAAADEECEAEEECETEEETGAKGAVVVPSAGAAWLRSNLTCCTTKASASVVSHARSSAL